MIIHIGDNLALLKDEIVMILDKKTVDKSKDSSKFIKDLMDNGSLITNGEEKIKTYIIALDKSNRMKSRSNKKFKLYTSNISSTALFKREKTNG